MRLTKKKMGEYAAIYQRKMCNVSATCTALQISRQTWYNWRENPEFLEKVEEAEEALLDLAESKLFEKVTQGDNTCMIFFLKTKGKKRGYVEGQEITATVQEKHDELDLSNLTDDELNEYESLLDKISPEE